MIEQITPFAEVEICPKVFNVPEFHFSKVYFFQNWYFSTTVESVQLGLGAVPIPIFKGKVLLVFCKVISSHSAGLVVFFITLLYSQTIR